MQNVTHLPALGYQLVPKARPIEVGKELAFAHNEVEAGYDHEVRGVSALRFALFLRIRDLRN